MSDLPAKMQSPWLRRGLAFLVDYTILMFLWTGISKSIAFPVPEIILTIIQISIFCGYFLLIEGWTVQRASLGKMICNLQVQTSSGEAPGAMPIFLRALILDVLILNWSEILGSLPLPVFLLSIIWSIPHGLMIYNGWLSIFSPDRLMLQDRFTRTKVVRSQKVIRKWTLPSPDLPEPPVKFPRPMVAAGFVTAAVLYGLIMAYFLVGRMGGRDIWAFPAADQKSVNAFLQDRIATDTGFRTEVNIVDRYEKIYIGSEAIAGRPATRNLEIKIWVPFIVWSGDTRAEIADIVVENLKVTRGYYDTGSLIFWTGTEYLQMSVKLELTLPE